MRVEVRFYCIASVLVNLSPLGYDGGDDEDSLRSLCPLDSEACSEMVLARRRIYLALSDLN